MIYKEELIEINKIIVEYLGGSYSIPIQTYFYQADANFIGEFRDIGLIVDRNKKYDNNITYYKLALIDFKFHNDWNWIMWLYEYVSNKGYAATIDPWSITFIEYISGKEDEILCYEFDREIIKIENYYYAITDLIKKIK